MEPPVDELVPGSEPGVDVPPLLGSPVPLVEPPVPVAVPDVPVEVVDDDVPELGELVEAQVDATPGVVLCVCVVEPVVELVVVEPVPVVEPEVESGAHAPPAAVLEPELVALVLLVPSAFEVFVFEEPTGILVPVAGVRPAPPAVTLWWWSLTGSVPGESAVAASVGALDTVRSTSPAMA